MNASVREESLQIDRRSVCCRVLAPTADTPVTPSVTQPILLLHGLGCSGDAWGPTLKMLGERGLGQPVYAPDLPGYGGSPGPDAVLGMAELADWATSLLDSLGIVRAHLAGHSMGCQIALEMARRHPERVGGIVLIGPTTGERRVPYWRYAVGLLLDGFREPLRYNLTLLRMYAQMGLRRYFATVGKMMDDEPLTFAGEVQAPCLVLRGQHDAIVPDRVARELAGKLPQGRFVLVNAAAHALQFSKADDFVALALPFWQEAEASLRVGVPPPGALSSPAGALSSAPSVSASPPGASALPLP